MAFLPAVVDIVGEDDVSIAQPNADGTRSPIRVKLGSGLSGATTKSGDITTVEIAAVGSIGTDGVQSITALRAVAPANRSDKLRVVVKDEKAGWFFDTAITTADDGVNYLKPNDLSSSDPGRWVRDPIVATRSIRGVLSLVDKQRIDFMPDMVSARAFCPESLLGHFANTAATAALPYLLSTGFASLALAQAAFPLITASGDLNSGTYATNSLDWACILEAIRYSEANAYNTVWLNHGGYGVVGTFKVHGGVKIKGQGSSGSYDSPIGTTLMHFSNGNMFEFLGDADPFSVGGFAGVGGGLFHVTLVKVYRVPYGGLSYNGGYAVYCQAQSPNKRPGEMVFFDVLVFGEGSPGTGGTWNRCFYFDGSKATTPGNACVRSPHMYKCRGAGSTDTFGTFYLKYVNHFVGTGCQSDDGSGSSSGITIEGDCNNVNFPGLICDGAMIIKDTDAVTVTDATNANPIVLTAAAHGFPVGQTAWVRVVDVGGNTAANGVHIATIVSTSTMSLPLAGNGAYTSGGTVQSTSPRDVNIQGRLTELDITSYDATGSANVSMGLLPSQTTPTSNIPTSSQFISSSPNFEIKGPQAPCFQFALVSTVDANVTGDGTTRRVTFTDLLFDRNGDAGASLSGGRYQGFVARVAGMYRIRGHVMLQDADSLHFSENTFATLGLQVTRIVGGNPAYSTRITLPPTADLIGGLIEDIVLLGAGDLVEMFVVVSGSATKNVSIFSDSGSGFTMLSGELI